MIACVSRVVPGAFATLQRSGQARLPFGSGRRLLPRRDGWRAHERRPRDGCVGARPHWGAHVARAGEHRWRHAGLRLRRHPWP